MSLCITGNIVQGTAGNQTGTSWALPFLKTIEQTIANLVENDDLTMDEIDELTTILHTLETDKQRGTNLSNSIKKYNLPLDALSEKQNLVQNTHIGYRIKKRLTSIGSKPIIVFFPKHKIRTMKDRAIELLMRMKSKQGIVIRKETRATKLVATVMSKFFDVILYKIIFNNCEIRPFQ